MFAALFVMFILSEEWVDPGIYAVAEAATWFLAFRFYDDAYAWYNPSYTETY